MKDIQQNHDRHQRKYGDHDIRQILIRSEGIRLVSLIHKVEPFGTQTLRLPIQIDHRGNRHDDECGGSHDGSRLQIHIQHGAGNDVLDLKASRQCGLGDNDSSEEHPRHQAKRDIRLFEAKAGGEILHD